MRARKPEQTEGLQVVLIQKARLMRRRLRNRRLAFKTSTTGTYSYAKAMDDRYGALHAIIGNRTELTTVVKLSDALGRWTTSALGECLTRKYVRKSSCQKVSPHHLGH